MTDRIPVGRGPRFESPCVRGRRDLVPPGTERLAESRSTRPAKPGTPKGVNPRGRKIGSNNRAAEAGKSREHPENEG